MDDIGIFDAIGKFVSYALIGLALVVAIVIAVVVEGVKDARRTKRQDPGTERNKSD